MTVSRDLVSRAVLAARPGVFENPAHNADVAQRNRDVFSTAFVEGYVRGSRHDVDLAAFERWRAVNARVNEVAQFSSPRKLYFEGFARGMFTALMQRATARDRDTNSGPESRRERRSRG